MASSINVGGEDSAVFSDDDREDRQDRPVFKIDGNFTHSQFIFVCHITPYVDCLLSLDKVLEAFERWESEASLSALFSHCLIHFSKWLSLYLLGIGLLHHRT